MVCNGKLLIPIFSLEASALPSTYTILARTNSLLRFKFMYSGPCPETENSIVEVSVKLFGGLVSEKYIFSMATWFGGTLNSERSLGIAMSSVTELK